METLLMFPLLDIIVPLIVGMLFGFAYRALLGRLARGTRHGMSENLGIPDRLLRFSLGVGLLVWAVTTTWSPLLLFFSGFCFFEAFSSWCGLYALVGRSTCPIA